MKNLLIAIFILSYFSSFSQEDETFATGSVKDRDNAVSGYIITKENEYKACFVIVSTDYANSEYVDFLKYKKAMPIRLTTKDILGYGYKDVVYELIPREQDSVFMQKMNKKEPFLYYYKSKKDTEFYIQKNGVYILLPPQKENLRKFLYDEMNSCAYSAENTQKAIYSKNRLTYIFDNHSTCDASRIPMFKVGITLGYFSSNMKLNSSVVYKYGSSGYFNLTDIKSSQNTGILFGVHTDMPLLGKGGKFSLHPGIEYGRAEYDFKKSDDINFGFDINYYTFNFYLRYKSLKRKHPFFADFGFVYSMVDVRDAYVLEYDLYHKLAGSLFGAGVGTGINITNYLDMSIRTNYLISESMPKVWNIQLIVGVEL